MDLSQKAKLKLFDIVDRLATLKSLPWLTEDEVLEKRNLEVQQMIEWSNWKDPK